MRSSGSGGDTALTSDLPDAGRRHAPQALGPRALTLLACWALCYCCCCWCSRPVDAMVSYCRDPSPHSYSHAQAEAICEIEGEYVHKTMVDNSNQNVLYGDLGDDNARKRYTAMTPKDAIIAKYANMSEYILHVQVIASNETIAAHHCCQVCYLDCEQFRYICPRTGVAADDNCTADATQVTTCRFTESVLNVKARLVCAIKAPASPPIPESWFTYHFLLRTERPGCPYRKLENGAYYLLMAKLSAPFRSTSDTLIGADMVIAVPKKSKVVPTGFLRGVALQQVGYSWLRKAASRNDSYCPGESSLKLPRSAAAKALLAGTATWTSAAIVTAVAVAANVLARP